MKNKKNISDFYDAYSEQQQKMWHNERHYFLIEQLKKLGLKKNSMVLEIGCGIGTVSNLIAPLIPKGKLYATDISPKSIEIAKEHNKKYSNALFFAADSTENQIPDHNYDFIVLFDVLEHIEQNDRMQFLENISKLMNEKTLLLINVPAPNAHIHAIETTPELMQIIEVPVLIEDVVPILKKCQLEIRSFFTYDMWQKDEYQFYLIEKYKKYVFQKTQPDNKHNPQSIKNRIKKKINNITS
ncbi:MAG: class I SAM-dependent methyltransferase [Bacteroidia bacterium]|nr:class I SAM-dependent methyltransferase [Bacteroidia bacterium]